MTQTPLPPAPPLPGAPPMPPAAPPKNNTLAVWSLICGIASLVCCLVFTGIPAIILGGRAKRQITDSGGTEGGLMLAKIGIVLGWISLPLTLLSIALIILLIYFMADMRM